MSVALRMCAAALLGLTAALLVSCGGSGKGLIPEANAGPLRADFEAVAQAAQSGDGSCANTEAALARTERDFLALPASVDRLLRGHLHEGIANLRRRALAMCAQPVPTPTTRTSTTPSTTPTQTTTATTPASTVPTTAAPPSGGTPAGEAEEQGKGKGKGEGGEAGPKGKGVGKESPEAGSEEGKEANSGGASAGEAGSGGGR